MAAPRWTPVGQMRSRITIQAPSTEQDSFGQPRRAWTDVYTDVPAFIIAKGGSEAFAQMQFEPKGLYELRIRWLPNITPLHGIVIQADDRESSPHYLDVQNVSDIDNRHRELLITCLERVNYTPFDA